MLSSLATQVLSQNLCDGRTEVTLTSGFFGLYEQAVEYNTYYFKTLKEHTDAKLITRT